MIEPEKGMEHDWGMFLGLDTILLPLRGFPSESDASILALRLAECAGANIVILHVTNDENNISEEFLNLKRRIEQIASKINVSIEYIIHKGTSPKDIILEQIKTTSPDLTIMTTRHEKGFPTTIKESFSSYIVKYSPYPLLIIHSRLGDFDSYRELEFERLMVLIQKGDAIDDSIVKFSIGMACKPIAWSDLIGLHIVSVSNKIPLNEFQADIEFQQQEKSFLRRLGQYSQLSGVVLRPKVVIGRSLGRSATYAARTENVDLLLLAVREKIHSRLPWRRSLQHTEMYQIAKSAPCTVAFYFAKE